VFRPFCSERCQLVDLQGWFGERYRIPQAGDSDQDDLDDPDDITKQNDDSLPN
jgi:endogenous inhibitor of DNA gyrase (YacG/DUF329 family)